MKSTKILIASLAIATMSSCSFINRFVKNDSQKPTKTESSMTSQKKTSNNYNKPLTGENDIADRLNGEWIIVSSAGKTIETIDEMPYLTFEKSAGKFYASNGCNIINGTYAINDANVVKFDNVMSTMKMCPETDYEGPITTALSGAEPLVASINQLGHESYLTLTNSKGTELLKARKHNMEFLNGNWQISSVNGKKIEGDEANLFIDIAELKVHGNTGCNFFNGQLFINPDKSNAIDFSNLITTRMACPNMEQESAILLALEDAATAIEGSEGRVMLLNTSGKELMTLKPRPVQPEE